MAISDDPCCFSVTAVITISESITTMTHVGDIEPAAERRRALHGQMLQHPLGLLMKMRVVLHVKPW